MKTKILSRNSLIWYVLCIIVLSLTACNLVRPPDESALEATKALVETYVAGTQTANAAPEDTQTPRPTRTELPTWTPKPQATSAPVEPTAIVHQMIPVGPGKPWSQLIDTYTGNNGAEQHTSEGDYYASQQLLERPFDQNMKYLAFVDIRAAELAKDETFVYVTFLMDQSVQTFEAVYAVELDVDADGRGDYLIWADKPQSSTWSMENMQIFADSNNDVGGVNVMAADAPQGGDGFDTLIFSIDQFTDPDLTWSRINPDRGGSVQIAFKPDFLDGGASFFWRVWVDAGIQNPGLYYYHDFYTMEEAGSPLKDTKDYPLGIVFAVDNTCRMPFQITDTGLEPGLCGNGGILPTSTPKPEISLTKLPEITKIVLPTKPKP